jgi:outer membrane protein assembly factor BamB
MQSRKKLTLLTLTIVLSLFIASVSAVSYFALLWPFAAYGQILPHALDSFRNVVYFGSGTTFGPHNFLYAVNITNGQEIWHYNTSLPVNYVSHFNISGNPSIVAGTGGSGSQPGKSYVIARSPSNTTLWKSVNLNASVTSVGSVESNVTGSDDIVAGLSNGTIVRLSGTNNGNILWKYPYANGTVFTVSNLKGGSIIAGSMDSNSNGHVYSLEMNGTLRWSFPSPPLFIVGRPLLKVFQDLTGDGIPEVIAAFHDGKIHVLNGATGQEVTQKGWPFPSPGSFSIKDLLCTQDYTGDSFPDIVAATDNGTLIIVNGQNASLFRGPTLIATSLSYIQYMYFYKAGKTYLNRTLAVSASDLGPPLTYSIRGVNATTLTVMKQYNPSAQALNLFNIGNFTSNFTGDLIFTGGNTVYCLSGTDIIVPEFASNFILISLIISVWLLMLVLRKRLQSD